MTKDNKPHVRLFGWLADWIGRMVGMAGMAGNPFTGRKSSQRGVTQTIGKPRGTPQSTIDVINCKAGQTEREMGGGWKVGGHSTRYCGLSLPG